MDRKRWIGRGRIRHTWSHSALALDLILRFAAEAVWDVSKAGRQEFFSEAGIFQDYKHYKYIHLFAPADALLKPAKVLGIGTILGPWLSMLRTCCVLLDPK